MGGTCVKTWKTLLQRQKSKIRDSADEFLESGYVQDSHPAPFPYKQETEVQKDLSFARQQSIGHTAGISGFLPPGLGNHGWTLASLFLSFISDLPTRILFIISIILSFSLLSCSVVSLGFWSPRVAQKYLQSLFAYPMTLLSIIKKLYQSLCLTPSLLPRSPLWCWSSSHIFFLCPPIIFLNP